MFGWCGSGKHKECPRSYRVFYIDPKGKPVYTGETRVCECPKRGCECYVKAADRAKKSKPRRKSK